MLDTTQARFVPSEVKAVVFDIGGVFLYPQFLPVQERLEAIGLDRPGTGEGPNVERFRRAHHAGCRALSDAVHAKATTPDEHEADFWVDYDRAYAAAVQASGHTETLRTVIRTRWDWAHEANIVSFHRLSARFPVAVVSNNDGNAVQQMIDAGVGQVGAGPLPELLAVVDSGVLGVAKPDPAIMTPALDAIGADPADVLYVGDTVHADVIGATNAGMQVVQLDPFDHHADFPHARVVDLAELADLLEAGY